MADTPADHRLVSDSGAAGARRASGVRASGPSLGRLVTVILATALVAVACSGGSGGDSSNASATAGPARPGELQADTAGDGSASASSSGLFSPTETGAAFDLTGGVTSSDEGVTLVTDSPRAALRDRVAQATEPWPTDWTRQAVDPEEFLLGIPTIDPRDRIPPIDTPKFEPIAEATWLDPREPGALVTIDGETRFYPLSILTRHEIVNDRFGDVPVAVTYCPLCNTALAFDRRVDGEVLRFGVSGLLRNSDLVMWDDVSVSLWQQITGEGVVGRFAGTQLGVIPTAITSYGDAVESFPDALSLSRDTGFGNSYGRNGYVGYSSSAQPFLFDGEPDPRFPALSRVVGVSVGEVEKAYPFSVISGERAVNDEVGGVPVAVFWGGDTADALDAASIAQSEAIGTGVAFDRRVDGQVLTFDANGDDTFTDAETGSVWTLLGLATAGPLEGTQLEFVTHRNEFWFAWAAFFPDAAVYG